MGSVDRQRIRAGGLDRYAREIEVTLADLGQRQAIARIWAKRSQAGGRSGIIFTADFVVSSVERLRRCDSDPKTKKGSQS